MSLSSRGARSGTESRLSGLIRECRSLHAHAARPMNTDSLGFLISVLMLFTILNSHEVSANFVIWLVLVIFLIVTTFRMCTSCQHIQAQARAHSAAASGLLGRSEFCVPMPPSIAFESRGRLRGLRHQLALLDHEFDELDYETLRALDSVNAYRTPSMREEEINALPLHKYKATGPLGESSSQHQTSSSSASASASAEIKQDTEVDVNMKPSEDELTCSICLEQANRGELIRSLPCLHQFHSNCIDPWLRQKGTCPVCKLMLNSGWGENRESETDGDDMV